MENSMRVTKDKVPKTKVIVPLPTPRADNPQLNYKARIISAMLKNQLSNTQDVLLCDNSNLSYKGEAVAKFLNRKDQYHLSDVGVSVLAANIRDTVDAALGLPRRLASHYQGHQVSPTLPLIRISESWEWSRLPTFKFVRL